MNQKKSAMKYDDKHIKNVALLGASKSGMTTLVEAMHYESGATNRRGNTDDGNTLSDYHEVEKVKGHSVYSQTLHVDWKQYKINMIDVPGIDDFIADVIRGLRVADTAAVLVNAQNGVEAHTETIWAESEKSGRPVFFILNQIDHPQSNYEESMSSLQEMVGSRILPVQFPVQEGENFHQIVDAISMVMYTFPEGGGKPEKEAIPEHLMERAQNMHQQIVEAAASNEEALMEKFFEVGNLSEEELQRGLLQAMQQHEVYPVFVVSAKKNMGSGRIMSFIDFFTPSPQDLGRELNAPAKLFIYKTTYEPNLGKMSYFKVMQGEVKSGQKLKNISLEGYPEESLGQLYTMDGKERQPVDLLRAGDVGAVIKLKNTTFNQTLCEDETETVVPPLIYPEDRIMKAVHIDNTSDEEKLAAALKKMAEQDPTFRFHYDTEQGQMLIGCQGEFQFDTQRWELEHELGLNPEFTQPKVAYRETISRSATGFYRHKKQTGGSGQFAEVKIKIEPYIEGMPDPEQYPVRSKTTTELPWGGTLEVISAIVGGVIDARFIPSIQKGIQEAMEQGPLQEAPMRDVRVIVYDGKMHPVDSNDIAFKTAGFFAFRDAVKDAKPAVLEPIVEVTLTVPEPSMGDALNEVQSRRGLVQNITSAGRFHKLVAQLPQEDSFDLSTKLRSITHGQGGFTSKSAGLRVRNMAIVE